MAMKKLSATRKDETAARVQRIKDPRENREIKKRKTERQKNFKEQVTIMHLKTFKHETEDCSERKGFDDELQRNDISSVNIRKKSSSVEETNSTGSDLLREIEDKFAPVEDRNVESRKTQTSTEKRKIANARERTRVHTLGAAFDSLRKVIPCYSANQRLSKLTILKVAISYISALDSLNKKLGGLEPSHFNRCFAENVDECTRALQSEYGRAKRKNWFLKP